MSLTHNNNTSEVNWEAFGYDLQNPPACMFNCNSLCEHCQVEVVPGDIRNPWIDSGFWKVEMFEDELTGEWRPRHKRNSEILDWVIEGTSITLHSNPLNVMVEPREAFIEPESQFEPKEVTIKIEPQVEPKEVVIETDLVYPKEVKIEPSSMLKKRSRSAEGNWFSTVPKDKRKKFH